MDERVSPGAAGVLHPYYAVHRPHSPHHLAVRGEILELVTTKHPRWLHV